MKYIILTLAIIFLLGCKEEPQPLGGTGIQTNINIAGELEQNMMDKCIQLCKNFKEDKTNGPCIGNPLENDWVCDIAHIPRQEIDNQPENQCSTYKEHFVEVDENCNLIRMK